MDQQHAEDKHDELAQAQKTIFRQENEIKALQQQLEREQFTQELRRLLNDATMTSIILSPFTRSRLLEMVVQTAADVISARSGSLFLIDEQAQDLVFEVAIGPEAQAVKQFRVPLGHGIAGLVAVSGQPMAIANADKDARLAIDIAHAVHYVPKSILCVPLFYEERIIGALELLDKTDASSFNPTDIQTLGLFANMAAIAIAQSQAYRDQQSVLTMLLRTFVEADPQRRQRLQQSAQAFSLWTETANTTSMRTREMALLVHELLSYGEAEAAMCQSILQSFVTNLRARQGGYDFSMLAGMQRR